MNQGLPTAEALLLDAGSSRLKWAWWRDGRSVDADAVAHQGDAAAAVARIATRYAPSRVVLATVLDAKAEALLVDALTRRFAVAVEVAVVERTCCNVHNGYKDPERLGIDRWLAMIAGYLSGGACVVADCGTAVTIDVVDGAGRHRGGQILPGLAAMARCLHGNTRVTEAPVEPQALLGTDTAQCIGAGIHHAVGALIERVVSAEGVEGLAPRVIITGGDAGQIAQFLTIRTEVRPLLVLDGLASWAGLATGE